MKALDNITVRARKDLENMLEGLSILDDLTKQYEDQMRRYDLGHQAQQLLATVADENATMVLGRVTQIINSALAEIFPSDVRTISMERKLHGNKHPHINVVLRTSDGSTRDMVLQSGSGLREIVSFMYRIILIEVTGKRKLVMMDELLRGVHKDAIKVVTDFMEMFAGEGFQFIYVEYGIPEDFGKMYEVIKEGRTARVEEKSVLEVESPELVRS